MLDSLRSRLEQQRLERWARAVPGSRRVRSRVRYRTTCFGPWDLAVEARWDADGLRATGRLRPDGADLETFAWLYQADPVFTLRFPDDRSVEVIVAVQPDGHRCTMVDYRGPAQRDVSFRS